MQPFLRVSKGPPHPYDTIHLRRKELDFRRFFGKLLPSFFRIYISIFWFEHRFSSCLGGCFVWFCSSGLVFRFLCRRAPRACCGDCCDRLSYDRPFFLPPCEETTNNVWNLSWLQPSGVAVAVGIINYHRCVCHPRCGWIFHQPICRLHTHNTITAVTW